MAADHQIPVEHGLPDKFFEREDDSVDSAFYDLPRFTTHIDDATISALTQYYAETLDPSMRILDLMSSWISHLPHQVRYQRVSAQGMNAAELEQNPRLDDYQVINLNESPALPWADDSFDAVLIAVSIQYLIRPFDVFAEIGRVLAPGGQCIVAMSHRLFPTKAIYAFKVLPPADRCRLVGSYMERGAGLSNIEAIDRSPPAADPLWIVRGHMK